MSPSGPPLLELRGITKRFPGVVANDGIDLDLRVGEVHALLGENGAGKSTLMNVLYGLYHPDEGSILVRGEPLRLRSPRDAIEAGIGMVHQHFQLIPVLTVAENIVLAEEPHRGPLMDLRSADRQVAELSSRYGLTVDPRQRVEEASVGQQQRAEILKALYRQAEVLILDEPTAVLSPQETEELFTVLRGLREDGRGIIFISHKLTEVLELADRITVLRRGRRVATMPREGATRESLAELMVGRHVDLSGTRRPTRNIGRPVLEIAGLDVDDDRGLPAVRDLAVSVRAGEVVAVAGVDGNGQTELVQAITGLRRPAAGRIALAGRDISRASPRQALRAGIGHIPEDRHRHGLVLEFSIAENVVIEDHFGPPVATGGWMHPRAMVDRAARLIKAFDVRGGSPETQAGALSGGNQQKLVCAREMDRSPALVIAAQPTRGLDIGAVEFVHDRLIAQRDAGGAVLLVSFELDEVLELADRILVMYEGRIALERPGDGATREELGLAMTGSLAAEPAPA
ncbi:MAG TPA: ABC transporter ATP-binding protein [Miltoncostaeaceae bacterium]|nr:ABC transporter ATP-binding protein [Miltoncostaeaceae bacterium]